jgi:hypothetical protein
MQSEFNSLWNTGSDILNNFKYNTLPSFLDGVTLGTAIVLPEVSLAASVMSAELTIEKDIKDGKGLSTKSLLSIGTTIIGASKEKSISAGAAAAQFLIDQLGANKKKDTKADTDKKQQQRYKKTVKSIKHMDYVMKPLSTYNTNNEQ